MPRSCESCGSSGHPAQNQIYDRILYCGEARLIGRWCRGCVRRFVARGWAIGLEIIPEHAA